MRATPWRWLVVGLVALAFVAVPAGARADGDPASDVLLTENLFLPFAPPVSAPLARALTLAIARAHAAGYPIKVALIGSPSDLGADPELFGTPVRYARFLDTEITYNNPPPLLVVMPQGLGTAGTTPARSLPAVQVDASARSDGLARAAIGAVVALAARAGHPIAAPALPGSPSGGVPVAAIAGVAIVLLALAIAAGLLIRRRRLRVAG